MPEEPSPASLRSSPSPPMRESEHPARKGSVGEGLRCAFARWPYVGNGLILLQDAATGGGTRHHYIIRFVDRPPGRRIRENGIDGGTCLAIYPHDARPLRREMLVAPGQQRQHYGTEVAPALG